MSALILTGAARLGFGDDLWKRFEFLDSGVFETWHERVMKGKVQYSIDAQDGVRFLRATSVQTASALVLPLKFSVQEYPRLSWEWEVMRFPEKTTEISKENDDYGARVYVIFTGFPLFNAKCIEYIWDEKMPEGMVFTSPWKENIRFIVAQSGAGGQGWVREERNVHEDYVKAFGEEPKRKIWGLALMSDSDNTRSSAEAWFRTIEIRKGP
ncbi:MAG: DUF3047 domain-containing protein [Candidatus Omnitrophica bacterium]|nr:DUF3047 domain-containing protein [Candidatus Omnitrophota bacterium]